MKALEGRCVIQEALKMRELLGEREEGRKMTFPQREFIDMPSVQINGFFYKKQPEKRFGLMFPDLVSPGLRLVSVSV